MSRAPAAQVDPRYFARRHDWVSLAVVTAHLLTAVLPIYAAAALGPGWHTVPLILLFGINMNGVLNLMHECAHALVFRHKRGSDWLGGYVIAPLVFADFAAYRRRHWDHHRFVGVDGETKDTYLIDISGTSMIAVLGRCVFLVEAIRKFFKQGDGQPGPKKRTWMVIVLAFQATFFLSILLFVRIVHPQTGWDAALYQATVAYVVVYLYGLMSVTVFMASLRAIAEHQQFDEQSATQGYAALRNFRCTPLTRYLMGAYGFGEHHTHHEIPGVPYYHLKALTTHLATHDQSLAPRYDYFRVLRDIVRDRRGGGKSLEKRQPMTDGV